MPANRMNRMRSLKSKTAALKLEADEGGGRRAGEHGGSKPQGEAGESDVLPAIEGGCAEAEGAW